jgi:hypothetical protein
MHDGVLAHPVRVVTLVVVLHTVEVAHQDEGLGEGGKT